jgi:hypothetical protein
MEVLELATGSKDSALSNDPAASFGHALLRVLFLEADITVIMTCPS